MYKAVTIILIAIIGMTCGSQAINDKSYNIQRTKTVSLDVCPTCINTAGEAINILLNLLIGVIPNTCTALCGGLAPKLPQVVVVFCDIACTVVGLDEFIKMIENADLDPIYYCELAKTCPVNDHGNCNVTQFSVTPATGVKGATFTIDATYVTTNGTGTGEIAIDIRTPDRVPLAASFLWESKKPGTYSERITIKAEPDPQCDPTQEPCEEWIPGVYNVTLDFCNGECGSKHPHSTTYSSKHGSFQLTG